MLLLLSACSDAGKPPRYTDPSLPAEDRVADLMLRMTLEEKVAQMCQYVGPEHMRRSERQLRQQGDRQNSDTYSLYRGMHVDDVIRLTEEGLIGSFLHVVTAAEANELQRLAQKSRLRIPLLIGIDAIHGNGLVRGSTIYPSPITMASMWCDSLVYEISRQTASEMRAMGAHWTFTPNIDIARDARWGRFGETAGEDTYLVGRMGVAQIEGYQQGDFAGPEKVIACAKHMIGGGDPVNGTNAAPTDISLRTLYETHLPPYERAVREAGVYTVMMAHNELNGIPCHNNRFMMTDLLRKEYGLKGFVVSDWMDIERLRLHGVADSLEDAFAQSVANGMDMHMHGPKFLEGVVRAVRDKRVPEARVNEACARILEAKFRLGLFENPFVEEERFSEKVFTPEHVGTALEAARKGIILLENRSVLPVVRNVRRIFLTGLNADNDAILGDWVHPQPEDHVVTVREGLEAAAGRHGVELRYFNCGEGVSRFPIPDLSKEAAVAARGSDLAVVVVGENPLRYQRSATCGENIDRSSLSLLNDQQNLVRRIKEQGIPVVVVFVTGRPLADEWIAEQADGIIWAWEPGCMGGHAIADILFGDVNPSGKLTATIPRSVGQIKEYYNTKPFHYFHPPVDLKQGPLYEFGYGLSYTDYVYSDLRLSSEKIGRGGHVTVSVDVKNIGDRDGEEIVQLYIRDRISRVTRPVKELKGYKRILIRAGSQVRVDFELSPRDLAYYGPDMELLAEKGEFSVMVGSSSRNRDLLTTTLELTETETFDQ